MDPSAEIAVLRKDLLARRPRLEEEIERLRREIRAQVARGEGTPQARRLFGKPPGGDRA